MLADERTAERVCLAGAGVGKGFLCWAPGVRWGRSPQPAMPSALQVMWIFLLVHESLVNSGLAKPGICSHLSHMH